MKDFSAFDKDIADGTTKVKSLKDAAKDVEDAQKAMIDVETELEKLRQDTDKRKRTLREVTEQYASRCLHTLTANMINNYLKTHLTIPADRPALTCNY